MESTGTPGRRAVAGTRHGPMPFQAPRRRTPWPELTVVLALLALAFLIRALT